MGKQLSELEKLQMKNIRAYARANEFILVGFRRETYSNELIGVAVKPETSYNGSKYYTFGRIHNWQGDRCDYWQQGCYVAEDWRPAVSEAIHWFGLNT